tara:strand:+ start:324 stop:1064 length:741 start_codon:yes stop_codon:yes gene_type:complete
MDDVEITISPHAKKRILKDVLDIIKNPLTEHGIYYKHNSNNMLKAKAIIIGPEDTIYEYGIFEFDFTFPTDYPFSPPKLKYMTNDKHNTRFHPNLYRNGKVCLSILNTWNGDQWTSCQSISTVLLTLTTLFHNHSLLNEPGITDNHRDYKSYHSIVKFRNFEYALTGKLHNLYKGNIDHDLSSFLKDKVLNNKDKIIQKIQKLINSSENNQNLRTSLYTLNAYTNYSHVLNNTKNIFTDINNKLKK